MQFFHRDSNSKFWQIIFLVVIVCFCLVLFIDKAVHVDDPLFIWAAQHIQSKPLDPYGFDVNWYGKIMPMYVITKNPPLASYYMAAMATLLGWGETALHFAFLIPAIMFIIGVYYLSTFFCKKPFYAALITFFTPVVLLSSTTLMCDLLMLCFWIWGMFFWIQGIREKKIFTLFLASVLVSLSALSKYFGICLILLLFAWMVIDRRKLESTLLILLIPIITLISYHLITSQLYGRGLLYEAALFSTKFETTTRYTPAINLLIGITFMGGCLITLSFHSNRLWSKVVYAWHGIIVIFLLILFINLGTIGKIKIVNDNTIQWNMLLHFVLFSLTGISLLFITVKECFLKRDSCSLMLFLWIAGTFLFTTFVNWTINGRTLLPIAPALGILLARIIESRNIQPRTFYISLIPAALVALLVTYSDYKLANTIRDDAKTIVSRYQSTTSTIWFQGHWGFQYYMQLLGGKPLDNEHPVVAKGDIIVMPLNNANMYSLPEDYIPVRDSIQSEVFSWLSCMNRKIGAGFYSHYLGPLPFMVRKIPPEHYNIHVARVSSLP